ncbi:MAG: hypothetical protein V7K48_08955 [Nostoc sp.]|uniref:hypothetical protein n=1 Tax=Nostoc sp. TaxID=1180 RepID=UPI002FFB6115
MANSQMLGFNLQIKEEINQQVFQEIHAILNHRLKPRQRIAKQETVDELHRFAILNHPVLINRMYLKLLSGEMSQAEWQTFFSNYYHASCRGFCCTVLPRALHVHKDKNWRDYIKAMIKEEKTPSSHFVLLKEFIDSCGLEIEESVSAQTFINALLKGFTADIPFSLGYSLGIEVEGAYQIDLIERSSRQMFSEQLVTTNWFKIHLSDTGEQEHANMAVHTIEKTLNNQQDYQRLDQGFFQACNDTLNFMESIYDDLKSFRI